jgi:hypothetical protein
MGWSFQEKPDNVKEYFDSGFNPGITVLDSAIVNLKTYYAAIKLPSGKVICSVIMLKFCKGREDSYYEQELGYKDMDENSGPNDSDCPERILRQLSPIEDEGPERRYAQAWRFRCWKRIALRKKAKKVKNRMAIQFERPIGFTNGITADTFFRDTRSGANAFTALGGQGPTFRISGWRMRKYKILP